MKKIVVALGGNALGNNPLEQLEKVKHAAKAIVDMVKEGHEVIIAHGNGPQVGMINSAFAESHLVDNSNPEMPFPESGAMSQGYIGYHLQNAIQKQLKEQDINKNVATIITQVEVDESDPAFNNPTKPIGSFVNLETAKVLEKEKKYIMVEDANRGYRRVVPSPKPKNIVELNIIKTLVEANHLVITVGGGGIPVIPDGNGYKGIAAVIDKDFASAKLADLLNADMLVILTAVDKVKLNFGQENEKDLDELSIKQMDQYIKNNEFHAGSMLPKVEACKSFVNGNKNRIALIASLEKAKEALLGKSGTKIIGG
ncbi:carbamate kinase [Mycoplasmatota bacterium]|nr:carbamate kinase [Mycoplasmatota bacterium]